MRMKLGVRVWDQGLRSVNVTQLLQRESLDGLFWRQIVPPPHVMQEIELWSNQDSLPQIERLECVGCGSGVLWRLTALCRHHKWFCIDCQLYRLIVVYCLLRLSCAPSHHVISHLMLAMLYSPLNICFVQPHQSSPVPKL